MRAATDAMEPLEGFATLGAAELARLTDSALRTTRRYIARGLAPRLVVRWLEVTLRGTLSLICRHWDGWTLRAGKLHSPEGHSFTPAEIRALPLQYQHISALERERRELTAALETERERREQDDRDQERRQAARADALGQARCDRGDFLNDRGAVRSDDHSSPPLVESAVAPPRRQPTLSFSPHVSCPACDATLSFSIELRPSAQAPEPHRPTPTPMRSQTPSPHPAHTPPRSAHRAPSRAVPAPVYASDP